MIEVFKKRYFLLKKIKINKTKRGTKLYLPLNNEAKVPIKSFIINFFERIFFKMRYSYER